MSRNANREPSPRCRTGARVHAAAPAEAENMYPSDGRRREHQFHRRDGSYGMQDPVRFNSV